MSLLAEAECFVLLGSSATGSCSEDCLGTPYVSQMTSVLLLASPFSPSSGITGVNIRTQLSTPLMMVPPLTPLFLAFIRTSLCVATDLYILLMDFLHTSPSCLQEQGGYLAYSRGLVNVLFKVWIENIF